MNSQHSAFSSLSPANLRAVIFDLDGVIVSTDALHYQAWKKVADEEKIPFNETINHRLRGVSRMESLAILLETAPRLYDTAERERLATRKNGIYRGLLDTLGPADLLPGAMTFCLNLRERRIKLAIGSSSRNSPAILEQLGISGFFDATADGNDIRNSKPDPEVFLLAACRLGVEPYEALVVEDAASGVQAAAAGGFPCLAVGSAQGHPAAQWHAAGLSGVSVETFPFARVSALPGPTASSSRK